MLLMILGRKNLREEDNDAQAMERNNSQKY
jgi:hypothetical protein